MNEFLKKQENEVLKKAKILEIRGYSNYLKDKTF